MELMPETAVEQMQGGMLHAAVVPVSYTHLDARIVSRNTLEMTVQHVN